MKRIVQLLLKIAMPLLATVTLIALAGCKMSPGPATLAIYTAGFYNNGNGTSTTACYWTNGVKTDLGGTGISTANPARATSIFAANGNVYVGGFYNNGSGYVGCYWVIDANGVTKTDLPGTGANVNAIFVSGTTIYMAGYYNNGTNVACYWTAVGNSPSSPVGLPSAGISLATSVYVLAVPSMSLDRIASLPRSCYWTIAGAPPTRRPGHSGAAVCQLHLRVRSAI